MLQKLFFLGDLHNVTGATEREGGYARRGMARKERKEDGVLDQECSRAIVYAVA